MKQNNYLYFLSAFALSLFLFSCKKDNHSDSNNNNQKTETIEMKVYPDKNNKVSFYATAKSLTIDWGDGNIEEMTPNGIKTEFCYQYTNVDFRTIKINAEQIVHFSFSKNFTKGDCHSLKFANCPDLKEIYCASQLTVLEIKNSPALEYLKCSNNQLTHLILDENPALKTLYCTNNLLTNLDLSQNIALTNLYCGGNQLTNLDLRNNIHLTTLHCYYNQLTLLEINGCMKLNSLSCEWNQLTEFALDYLFENLPTKEPNNNARIYISENPGTNNCEKSIAENKGWNFR